MYFHLQGVGTGCPVWRLKRGVTLSHGALSCLTSPGNTAFCTFFALCTYVPKSRNVAMQCLHNVHFCSVFIMCSLVCPVMLFLCFIVLRLSGARQIPLGAVQGFYSPSFMQACIGCHRPLCNRLHSYIHKHTLSRVKLLIQ